jgi:hypothetical protein
MFKKSPFLAMLCLSALAACGHGSGLSADDLISGGSYTDLADDGFETPGSGGNDGGDGGTGGTGGGSGSGGLGEDEPVTAIASGVITYNGHWSTESDDGKGMGNGALHLSVDFDDGTFTGDINGAYVRKGGGGASVMDGTADGTVSGGDINGTILVDGSGVSGVLYLLGSFADDAGSASGTLGGSLETSAGVDAQSGTFAVN